MYHGEIVPPHMGAFSKEGPVPLKRKMARGLAFLAITPTLHERNYGEIIKMIKDKRRKGGNVHLKDPPGPKVPRVYEPRYRGKETHCRHDDENSQRVRPSQPCKSW